MTAQGHQTSTYRASSAPRKALERLAEQLPDWTLTKAPGSSHYSIRAPRDTETSHPRTALRTLALFVAGLRGRDDFQEIRQTVKWDPGSVPPMKHAWEEDMLYSLALKGDVLRAHRR